ncbi:MAG: hypothetical protein RJB60_723 [Pseudomonadota bacterium]|jgi:hypothetical protein
MNWFDNVSSDSDQPIAPACLYQGHWRHRLHAFDDLQLCRVVIDVMEARVVAAQVIERGEVEDLSSSQLEDLTASMVAQGVLQNPSAWGLSACAMLPTWAKATFSEKQIEELERIEGYLIEASEESIDSVIELRDQFLRGIGLTYLDVDRAVRQAPQHGMGVRKTGRGAAN